MIGNTKARTRAWPLLLGGLLAALTGCGEHTPRSGTGETHFLRVCDDGACPDGLRCVCGACTAPCASNDDCTTLGAEAACLAQRCEAATSACDVACVRDQDCAAFGEGAACTEGRCRVSSGPLPQDDAGGTDSATAIDAGQNGDGSQSADATVDGGSASDAGARICPEGCSPIVARPIRRCVEQASAPLPSEWQVACECGTPPLSPSCHRRVADGSAWSFAATELADPGAWTACDTEQEQASTFSCDFSQCPLPIHSTCSRVETCNQIGCGGFTTTAEGCARAECESEADCPSSERCTASECGAPPTACEWSPTGCECLTPPPTCYPNRYCHPTAEVGPRGEWVALEVRQATGPCGAGDCSSTWTLTPDGQVAFVKRGSPGSATLEELDLEDLARLLDTAALRVALRDGLVCDPPPTDVGVTITLTLDTETLTREATGCAIAGPAGNPLQRVYQTAVRY